MRSADRDELIRMVRDVQIVDREDAPCGIVDDVVIEEFEPGLFQVKALLIGPGAWTNRRPRWLWRLLRPLTGDHLVRIDAQDVASVTSVVRLLCRARDRDLARAENRLLAKMNR